MKLLSRAGIAALSLLALAACTESKDWIGSEWRVNQYRVNDGWQTLPAEANFTLQLTADGKATGRVACNRWNSSYTLNGHTLTLGSMAMTRMRCPLLSAEAEAFSNRFTSAFNGEVKITVTQDGLLSEHAGGEQWRWVAVSK